MKQEADDAPEHQKGALQAWANNYHSYALPGGNTWHTKPSDALEEIQCSQIMVAGVECQHWGCVSGKCDQCPIYPVFDDERKTDSTAPIKHFHVYEKHTTCSLHGPLGSKECSQCHLLPDGFKRGKILMWKELTLKVHAIGTFMDEFYLPAIKKYAYHSALFIILSKNGCGIQ